jgi:hypothetical protein
MADARISQDTVEILSQPTAIDARVSQDVIEILNQPIPAARITQDVIELLHSPPADARVSQYIVEILAQNIEGFERGYAYIDEIFGIG